MPPRCLAIFDHDGVLVDSLAMHSAAWVELGRRVDLPIDDAFVRRTFGMTNPSIFAAMPGPPIDAGKAKEYADLKESCYRDLARGHIALMPGVRELLDGLTAAGVTLAIGSSGVRPNLNLTVEEAGLAGRFAAIASLEDITRGKPDPEVFLVAAARCGVVPGRCVVFEDAPVGISAAKAAGMRAVGVGTTHPLADLTAAGADEVVADLRGYPVAALVALLEG